MSEAVNNPQEIPAPAQDSIGQTGSITAHTTRGTIHCITIIGQIEGHMEAPAQTKTTKYEHIIPQITAVEEMEDIDGLLVLINTVGGDVEAGLAIAELIGRRAFDWRAAGGRRAEELYCRVSRHDHPPGTDERGGNCLPHHL